MKIFVPTLAALLLAPGLAFANCDVLPTEPAVLLQSQISVAQLEEFTPQMEGYLLSLKAYKSCVEGQVAQLLPPSEELADEYFSSPEYQSQFDALEQLLTLADQQKKNAVAHYNNHITTAVSE